MAWHCMEDDPLLASRRYRSRQPYLEESLASCCLRRLACIMRHVRFSMRSWLGKLCFVLLKKRQTWAASGSSLPKSAGLVLIPAMPSWKPANASVLDKVPRALSKVFERSKRTSLRLPRISAVFLDLLVVVVLDLWVLLGLPLVTSEAVPILLLVLAGAERSDCSGLMSPGPLSAGLRGNRKSCSVEVGLIEIRGLDVDMAAMSYGRVESALNGVSWGGDAVVKRGKREDFGQNGGNSWDLYRPSSDPTRDKRGSREALPHVRLAAPAPTPTLSLSHSHTHTLSQSLTRTPLQAQAQAWLGWAGGPFAVLAVSPSVVCGLSRLVWFWSLVRRVGGVPLLFFFFWTLSLEPGEESAHKPSSGHPRLKQQPGPPKVELLALANQGR